MPHVKTVLLTKPTWANHQNIFKSSGFDIRDTSVLFYFQNIRGLDFDGMVRDLEAAPSGSLVVFHPCAHNPTGKCAEDVHNTVARRGRSSKSHIPLFDMAYQVGRRVVLLEA